MPDAISASPTPASNSTQVNSPARVLIASLVGTTIEFFDFYVYATAAVLVFPHLFFPASDSNAATLQSLVTFSIAFFARPIGAVVFGHFGDRIGRKATLVAALMTMGLSTVLIGMLAEGMDMLDAERLRRAVEEIELVVVAVEHDM